MTDHVTDANDPLLECAKRALGLVEAHGGVDGNPNRPRVSRPTRMMDEALVELMTHNVDAGYVTPPGYLQRPAHLPDNDRELQALFSSDAARDVSLRVDMMEWVSINRRVVSQGVATLRNAIVSIRLADTLLNESDENDTRIAEWKGHIEAHVYKTYRITAIEAPENLGELEVWCEAKLNEWNPVPEWLREGKPDGKLFVPKKRSTMRVSEMRVVRGKDDDDE